MDEPKNSSFHYEETLKQEGQKQWNLPHKNMWEWGGWVEEFIIDKSRFTPPFIIWAAYLNQGHGGAGAEPSSDRVSGGETSWTGHRSIAHRHTVTPKGNLASPALLMHMSLDCGRKTKKPFLIQSEHASDPQLLQSAATRDIRCCHSLICKLSGPRALTCDGSNWLVKASKPKGVLERLSCY